jgi:hypothetical protein
MPHGAPPRRTQHTGEATGIPVTPPVLRLGAYLRVNATV